MAARGLSGRSGRISSLMPEPADDASPGITGRAGRQVRTIGAPIDNWNRGFARIHAQSLLSNRPYPATSSRVLVGL